MWIDMEKRFEVCVARTLRHEGLYVDHPSDAGGATNYGISLRFLKRLQDVDRDGFADGDIDRDGDVDADDVRALTLGDVKRLLRVYFFDIFTRLNEIRSIRLTWKIFDLAVNMSPLQSMKLVQRAAGTTADGILGSASVFRINAWSDEQLLHEICREQALYYTDIVSRNATQLAFLKGWIMRSFDTAPDLKEAR